jgi:hypothetical protein
VATPLAAGSPNRFTKRSSPHSSFHPKTTDSTNSATICETEGPRLLERDGSRYAYQLTDKGIRVALLFLFFHKRLCGPLANSRFPPQTRSRASPNSKLEIAYHKADRAIQKIVDLLAA